MKRPSPCDITVSKKDQMEFSPDLNAWWDNRSGWHWARVRSSAFFWLLRQQTGHPKTRKSSFFLSQFTNFSLLGVLFPRDIATLAKAMPIRSFSFSFKKDFSKKQRQKKSNWKEKYSQVMWSGLWNHEEMHLCRLIRRFEPGRWFCYTWSQVCSLPGSRRQLATQACCN